MKLATAAQMKELDRQAIEDLGFTVRDVGKQTLCRDYESSADQHNCWLLTLKSGDE